jgi:hypothetical protein
VSFDSGQWNEELIREIFIPVDAAAILRIPLRSQDDDDCWAWEPEKHGIYSVKTAYQKLEQVRWDVQVMFSGRKHGNSMFHRRCACFGGECSMSFCRQSQCCTVDILSQQPSAKFVELTVSQFGMFSLSAP